MKRKMIIGIAILLMVFVIGLTYVAVVFYPQLPIANGYAAKKMCSCVFIAGRSQKSIQEEDLAFGPLGLTKTVIDKEKKEARTTILGMAPRIATYRDRVGCILLNGNDDYHTSLILPSPLEDPYLPWPQGNGDANQDVDGVDYEMLDKAIANAFDPSMEMDSVKTRALLVVYKDTLIGEKYATGFDRNTEILGWSMTKSVTAAMMGMLIKDGKLSLDEDELFDEWKDGRSAITLRDMLQMQSGLEFDENYGAISDATKMLYMSDNISQIPLSQPLTYDPGSHWAYSSGTTNLLSQLIRDKIGDHQAYLEFPYKRLFDPLGMNSAALETDESGLYIGSSYMCATPRDWAKFGKLFLHNGSWDGNQLIDSSFVDFIKEPAKNSNGFYGGHFWLNANHSHYPDVPEDIYMCLGFQGQQIIIVPSHQTIIVRMGLEEWPVYDPNQVISEVLASLDPLR